SLAMTAMQKRKHMAAYPPGTYIDATPSPTWLAENDLRYASDPYAEDLIRLFNYYLNQMSVATVALADEADDLSTPIPGTNDLIGLGFNNNAYTTGIAAAALASSGLAGTVAQVGDANRVRFKPIEVIAQQLVDYMVFFQNDAGSYPGSFYYTPNANSPDASTSEWMYSGLHALATSPMAARGVYVNNLVKARIGSFLRQSIHVVQLAVTPPDPVRPYGTRGFSYTPALPGYSFQLSAGPLMMLGLMGWNNPLWEGSTALIPNAVGFSLTVNSTRGDAYATFRQVFDYIGDEWNGIGGQDGQGWDVGQWPGGAGGYNRSDNDYNLYAIQWAAKGLAAIGAVCVGGTEAQDANGACTDGNDWRHQHTVLLVRRQVLDSTGAKWEPIRGNAVNSLMGTMKTSMALLTLTLAQ
ncbi:MAG: hypothetical protein Q8N51_04255, partial [Gammaproteobacteria bacterium]|nr:hypothetical protein [Gammaproteobacteria bacterium]